MKIGRGITPILIALCYALTGCSPRYGDLVVLEVGSTKVTLKEYEDFYTRNSGSYENARQSSIDERERFLDLLTNYKLKLKDAYDRQLLSDPEVAEELKEYRASLATTFMLDREVTEPALNRLYDRRKEEIRAKHILLSVKPDASPEDTLNIYTKALDIIHRVKAGESFDSLVAQYSEDPSAKNNFGDIYYFTAGQMVTPFEDAAYSMKVGDITSLPVRSGFGYHIIKILDRQPVRGTIRVRHIMTTFKSTTPEPSDSADAYARIKGFQDSLRQGADFVKLATKVSEDAGSASQGGDLNWFDRRRWVQPFEEAAFKLRVGEVSGVVRTPFGYHLIRLDSVRPLPPYRALREELKRSYQQNRYGEDYARYTAQLKTQFRYAFDEDVFATLLSELDSTKSIDDSAWDGTVSDGVRKMALLSINGKPISVDSVLRILEKKPDYRGTALRRSELRSRFDRIADALLLEEKSIGLEDRHQEFASLMQEYTDGIILYKAEQTEVWNQTAVTDSAIRAFYDDNPDRFVFPERVNYLELYVESDTMALILYDSLLQGADIGSLSARWSADPELRTKRGKRGFQPVDADESAQEAMELEIGEFSEPFEKDGGGYAIVHLVDREPARRKSFEEAGAEVSNAYQEYLSKQLEQDWLERIRNRHPVKQNREVLKNAFSYPQKNR